MMKKLYKHFDSTAIAYARAQWHPEKAIFEFNSKQHIPHQPAAILLTQVNPEP